MESNNEQNEESTQPKVSVSDYQNLDSTDEDMETLEAKRRKIESDMESEGELFSLDDISQLDDESSSSSGGVDFDLATNVADSVKNEFEEWVLSKDNEGMTYQDMLRSLGFYYLATQLTETAAKNIVFYVINYIKFCKDLEAATAAEDKIAQANDIDECNAKIQEANVGDTIVKTDNQCPTNGSAPKDPQDLNKSQDLNASEIDYTKELIDQVDGIDGEERNGVLDSDDDDDSFSDNSYFTFPPKVEEFIEADEKFATTNPIDILYQLTSQLRLQNEIQKSRKKLPHINTVSDVVKCIEEANNIIVLSGAGISVSCGIPDFRSPGGLYDQVREKYALTDPQYLFDISYFRVNPNPFYDFAQQLFPDERLKPSDSHLFIKLLESKNKLLRNYSQNIDTLEKVSGIPSEKVLLCHGSFATFSCLNCKTKVDGSEIQHEIKNKILPRCKVCDQAEGYTNVMKPDIVFFGESLSDDFKNTIIEDIKSCDLLIVMGSSLQVQPVALIPSLLVEVSPLIPQILINRESVRIYHEFDYHFRGDSDSAVAELCHELGWENDLKNLSQSIRSAQND